MTILRTVRVAAVQATSVILDAEATVHKAVRLFGEAANAGAEHECLRQHDKLRGVTRRGWIAHMRAIAIESGAFVVSVPPYIPRAAFPEDFPLPLPEQEVFGNGGALIVEPTSGTLVAGPLYGEEGMLVHDCDLRLGLHAKRVFDAVGHYSRDDVLGGLARVSPSDSDEDSRAVSPESAAAFVQKE